MPTRRAVLVACIGALLCAASTNAAVAQANAPWRQRRRRRRRRRQRRLERQRLRGAVARGEVRPLFEMMQIFHSQVDGEVLDVRYRERGPHRVYVFVVLLPEGRVTRYVMDARSGRIFTLGEALKHYGLAGED